MYSFDNKSSVKFSYNKTIQYLHLISNTTIPTPYDMWKPCNNNIKPTVNHQFSAGYFTSINKQNVDLSLEMYYKKMYNIIDVKPGADITLNKTLDADLMEGKGYAYGIEFLLDKQTGKNLWSVSYTYGRSVRKIDKMYTNDGILPDNYYPSNYDIPHNISIIYSYHTSRKGIYSINFTYQSGRPITLPDGQYVYFETLLPYYSKINQHRLPDYHRLDFSYTKYCKNKPGRKWTGFWVFSIYNLYARKNAYSIYIERQTKSKNTQATQLSVIGTIVPSVSFTFKI
jgi:hypothetical protein